MSSPPTLHDLGHLLRFKIIRELKDGAVKGDDWVFLVQVRRRSSSFETAADEGVVCVLKIYSSTRNKALNDSLYNKEFSANAVLNMQDDVDNEILAPEAACGEIWSSQPPDPDSDAENHQRLRRFPRCFGLVSVPEARIFAPAIAATGNGPWIDFASPKTPKQSAGSGICRGFLFEYFDGLRPLTKETLTREIANSFVSGVKALHERGIRHGNLEDVCAYPEIRFANVFLRDGHEGVFIIDFNRAQVLADNECHQALRRDEEVRVTMSLDKVLSNEDPWKDVPKETRRLLGRA